MKKTLIAAKHSFILISLLLQSNWVNLLILHFEDFQDYYEKHLMIEGFRSCNFILCTTFLPSESQRERWDKNRII